MNLDLQALKKTAQEAKPFALHEGFAPASVPIPAETLTTLIARVEELEAALPHIREQIISDLIGPEASLTASVRAFKTGWHQADMEGRVGERTADGLRNVVNARIARGEA